MPLLRRNIVPTAMVGTASRSRSVSLARCCLSIFFTHHHLLPTIRTSATIRSSLSTAEYCATSALRTTLQLGPLSERWIQISGIRPYPRVAYDELAFLVCAVRPP